MTFRIDTREILHILRSPLIVITDDYCRGNLGVLARSHNLHLWLVPDSLGINRWMPTHTFLHFADSNIPHDQKFELTTSFHRSKRPRFHII
jgi:hypothetical protein